MTLTGINVLLVDDLRTWDQVRPGPDTDRYRAIARTKAEFEKLVRYEAWDIIYLDHDLGEVDEHGFEFTGMHALAEIERLVEEQEIFAPTYIWLVTSNASVRRTMQTAIDRMYERWHALGYVD